MSLTERGMAVPAEDSGASTRDGSNTHGRHAHAMIRPALEADYPALAEVFNLCWPTVPETPEDLFFEDSQVYEQALQKRFVAIVDGRIVGTARYYQIPGRYHPERFWLEVEVHPDFRNRGIGSSLFETIRSRAISLGGQLLRFSVPSDREVSLAFLAKRGYAEEWRSYEVQLDLRDLSSEGLKAEAAEILQQAGATLCTLREARDAGLLEDVYRIVEISRQDTSFNDAVTPWGLENFERSMLQTVDLDGGFVASIDGKVIGVSYLLKFVTDGMGDQGWTGVDPLHRRKGLARALKKLTVAAAIDKGCTGLATNSHSLNKPMRTLNDEFGFREVFAWVYMARTYPPREIAIREATIDDMHRMCELRSHTMTEPVTVEMMRIRLETFKPEWHWSRWVACDGDYVVGAGHVYHWEGLGDLNYYLNLDVDPDYKNLGIGGQLMDLIEARAREVGAKTITGVTRGDRPSGVRFAEGRGFELIQQLSEGQLDMNDLNVEAIEAAVEQVKGKGFRLATYAELGDTPENRRMLHGFYNETDADTPGNESWGDTPFEVFEVECFRSPNHDPNAILVALDGDRWAGISMVCKVNDEEYGTVYTGT